MIASLCALVTAVHLVSGTCDCGYSIQSPEDEGVIVFMDRLETDFGQLQNISQSHDWVAQEFTVSAEDGRGNYSKAFEPTNVAIQATHAQNNPSQGNGVELRVSSTINNDAIPGSEIDTTRLDLHWGSFRAGIKLTDVKGTCAAFFWYFNDTQEIDIEFLSQEFDHGRGVYPANLVVQSRASMEAGYDASKTGNFKRVDLDFDPTESFHEYRFDYIPGHVLFYADSKLLAQMNGSDMPTSGGHLILQHWSNGNPLWSGGPPTKDATITVSYVKAYFNSSDPKRQTYLQQQCGLSTERASVCTIQNVTNATSHSGDMPHDSDDNDQSDAAVAELSLLGGLGLGLLVLFL
ncbi:hypothetical protein SNK03_011358 [Fusarium graminearum]|uniref:Chromosome 3, complete genome n=1 Tax=Gibberella zeae (strain ATCC MYA-4620 / CBS 123657 / FGSC 9075 / NRRL 31084 / PH-1) TaxID=229533 RepID=I1RN38_GIBZE|nr:hypothetical protein FGSG_05400 [Fusarium graminearum PH-1]EYB30141.1 hypothetical protein FG05_05400 [Fusarium graminearum]ESU11355.1 hypothetical protein FGSG_05400 [Fusarium graminearum PH-1]CAF3623255.1 unnamed protein product [Fusarium graminearum]CEF86553.1 unnamed protein product [Fusarium graminearum]CZS84016.1 unnamed protein product [Fusarium graminearum]|eukprot:XP_011323931.1 hypothetical protein FGSG_05400 [Fusarium graminearum PH-1]